MQTNLLDIRNLSVEFTTEHARVHALNQVTFSLEGGQTLGIVGESGSGKSVTALSIMNLLPSPQAKITGGEIQLSRKNNNEITEVNLLTMNEKEISRIRGREIAMIFQEPMTSLNPVLTCGEQVSEAIRVHFKGVSHKEGKLRVVDLFKSVSLPEPEEIYKSYPHQLSGGQKQRVMIAMAISCNPSFLIADEPTTALDVTVQASILKLLKDIREKNKAGLIFISHDLGVIAEIADRVLVMYKGQIVEQGKTEDIFRNPQHPYTKGLLACRPYLNKKLRRLPEISDFMVMDEHKVIKETGESVEKLRQALSITQEEEIVNREKLYSRLPVLKAEALKTRFRLNNSIFGKRERFLNAVDDVSFEVFPGETLGLAGESGCGKTTLGRTILRLITAHSGRVEFMGKDLFSLGRDDMRIIRKRIQMIFQDPYSSLNPRLTIGEAILEPMQVHHLHGNDLNRKEKVVDLLEHVNLKADHYERYPHEFSGGQRQRIVIARALAVEPEFIICDEPVSALDVSVQAQVLNLLNDLKKDFNLSYIFISHDLSVVKFMSDRMIVMNNGKIEEMGYPDTIYRNPSSEYTKRLIDAIPGQKWDN